MAKAQTTRSASVDPWIDQVENASADFVGRYGAVYSLTERELSGVFEIGCFLAIIADYERQSVTVEARNLIDGGFRYLTTPNGNPRNFSYVRLSAEGRAWELRQQVRICSYIHDDVNFTPDIVVIAEGADIRSEKDRDYASGKRSFFRVNSDSVIAAHECKSMTGFPELYVSFVGMFLMAHSWFGDFRMPDVTQHEQGHLAPSLFVGSEVSNLHRRMVGALESQFPINLVTGLHRGGWALVRRTTKVNRIPFDAVIPAKPTSSG